MLSEFHSSHIFQLSTKPFKNVHHNHILSSQFQSRAILHRTPVVMSLIRSCSCHLHPFRKLYLHVKLVSRDTVRDREYQVSRAFPAFFCRHYKCASPTIKIRSAAQSRTLINCILSMISARVIVINCLYKSMFNYCNSLFSLVSVMKERQRVNGMK